jgi:hypothetical protein
MTEQPEERPEKVTLEVQDGQIGQSSDFTEDDDSQED